MPTSIACETQTSIRYWTKKMELLTQFLFYALILELYFEVFKLGFNHIGDYLLKTRLPAAVELFKLQFLTDKYCWSHLIWCSALGTVQSYQVLSLSVFQQLIQIKKRHSFSL